MNCNEVQNKLSSYRDGMLSDKEQSSIREHLLLCPECNREYLLLTEMLEILETYEYPKLPSGFDAELRELLMQPIHEKKKPAAFWENKNFYRKYGSLAAVLFVVIASATVLLLKNADFNGGDFSDVDTMRAETEQDMMDVELFSDAGSETNDEGDGNQEIKTNPDGDRDDQSTTGGETDNVLEDGKHDQNQEEANIAADGQKTRMNESDGSNTNPSTSHAAMSIMASEEPTVMDAAYAAGAGTYNDALDFVSLIADNNMEGLTNWIKLHAKEEISNEAASELATFYMEKYKVSE